MRSTDGITYEVVSDLLPGAGTSDAVLNYGFEDSNVPGAESVFYRLDQIDLDGARWSDLSGLENPVLWRDDFSNIISVFRSGKGSQSHDRTD